MVEVVAEAGDRADVHHAAFFEQLQLEPTARGLPDALRLPKQEAVQPVAVHVQVPFMMREGRKMQSARTLRAARCAPRTAARVAAFGVGAQRTLATCGRSQRREYSSAAESRAGHRGDRRDEQRTKGSGAHPITVWRGQHSY